MKIQLFHFENDLDFIEKYVNVLQIKNPSLFNKIVKSFYQIEIGEEPIERIKFYIEDEEKEVYKKIKIIIDYYCFELNNRKEINSIYKIVEQEFNSRENVKNNFHINITNTINELREIFWNEDIDLRCDDYFSIIDFLRFINLKYDCEEFDILKKIMLLIDFESIFSWNELLIFVNLSSFLIEDDLIKIFRYATAKKVKILLIENNMDGPTLYCENKLIIDDDFVELLLNN